MSYEGVPWNGGNRFTRPEGFDVKIGPWVFLAVVISGVAHLGGWWMVKHKSVPLEMVLAEAEIPKPQERIRISPDLLRDTVDVTPLEQVDLNDVLEPKEEIARQFTQEFANQDINMVPKEQIRPEDLQTPALNEEWEKSMVQSSEQKRAEYQKNLEAFNRRVLAESQSMNQMKLAASTSPIQMDDQLINQLPDMMGKGGGPAVPGFSSLDDVISGAGKGMVGKNAGPIMMPTDLLFEYNQADLLPGAQDSMQKLAYIIEKNADKLFIIEGHTDTIGGEDYNLDLSLRRAEAVKTFLTEVLRVSPDRIQTLGMGKQRPLPMVNAQGTAEEQRLNRRVEIRVRSLAE